MKKALFVLSAFILISACTKDKPSKTGPFQRTVWGLTDIKCFCAPINSNDEVQSFTFQPNGILLVENTADNASPNYLPTGEYDYVLNDGVVSFEGFSYTIDINDEGLSLSYDGGPQIIDEEVLLLFEAQ